MRRGEMRLRCTVRAVIDWGEGRDQAGVERRPAEPRSILDRSTVAWRTFGAHTESHSQIPRHTDHSSSGPQKPTHRTDPHTHRMPCPRRPRRTPGTWEGRRGAFTDLLKSNIPITAIVSTSAHTWSCTWSCGQPCRHRPPRELFSTGTLGRLI
jgi:hypothetical protein